MSATNRGSQRRDKDAYYTDDRVALGCVRAVNWGLGATFLEPSVGGGAFARALEATGHKRPDGIDIDPNAAGFAACEDHFVGDFTSFKPTKGYDYVIGNPPYNLAQEHIEHAWTFARHGVGFLLRINLLGGNKRRAFWDQYRPAEIHMLRPRPSFTGGGTDATEYAFFVWRPTYNGRNVQLNFIDWR